jgi:stage II sporulation protein D
MTTCKIQNNAKQLYIEDACNKHLLITKKIINVFFINQNTISVDGCILSLPVLIKPSEDGFIFIGLNSYRGDFILQKSYTLCNSFDVINIISIENYLKGVIPKEVNENWDIEALKVQSIASRTYSILNYKKHEHQGFNLCSTTHCQVYGGLSAEAKKCNIAVMQTEGKILMYKGELAHTVFHSTCGGHTENSKYIWYKAKSPKYLRGVKCSFCSKSPYFRWQENLDEDLIRNKLLNNIEQINIGNIQKIKVKSRTQTGTAKTLKIIHSKGKFLICAYQFRLIINPYIIKSHAFSSIKHCGDKFYFTGKGWGHMVGLCQWGTKVMAEQGKTCSQILKYFFPKTKINTIQYQ